MGTAGSTDTAPWDATPKPDPRPAAPRSPVLVAAGVAVLVVALYLVGTFAAPRRVPRLAVLPKPGPDRAWYDECNGQPGNRHQESWMTSGGLWILTEMATTAGCLER